MPKAKEKEKAIAEDLFVRQGWTGKAIADLLNIQEKTVSKWRTEGLWEKLREETIASPGAIRQLILQEMRSIVEGKGSKIDADALSKLGKVNDSLSDRVSPQIVITVMAMFDEWFANENPKAAIEMLDPHKRFIHHVIQLQG